MTRSTPPGKTIRALAAGLLGALLCLAACGPSSAPSADEGNVFEIANIAPITGPTAGPEQINLQALEDYVRYFNEDIGIPGVTIKLLWADESRDTSKFVSAYQRFRERGINFMYSDDTIAVELCESRIEKDQVPFVTGSSAETVLYPPGWVYAPYPTFGESSAVVLDYFMDNWKEDRPAKVVYFGSENELGRGSAEAAEQHIRSTGMNMELLPFESIPYVVIDATPQLMRTKDRGADLVMIQQIVPGTGPVLRDAQRLGLLGEMQFAGFEFNLGNALIKMVGDVSDGFIAPRSTPWFDETDVPGMKTIQEVQKRYHGTTRPEPEYMGGWLGGSIMCEAARRTVERVGIDNVTGAAIKDSLDSMDDFDLQGIATINYTNGERRGTRTVAVYEIQDGKIVRVSDWMTAPILVG